MIEQSGSFNSLEKWLKKKINADGKAQVESLGEAIIRSLKNNTPTRSGKTASSWYYKVKKVSQGWELEILNSNIVRGVSIAKIIHFGHGTGTGGYVPAQPYITEAIDSVYNKMIQKILSETIK